MILKNQTFPLEELSKLSKAKSHSILIHGPQGSGKTYLAKQYAEILKLHDFNVVGNDVSSIRDAINSSYDLDNDQVICIENLDCGRADASFTLLKFLEEPLPHTYIVVTCRNINKLPDTIMSRSAVVNVGPPISSDIEQFAKNKDLRKFDLLSNQKIWRAVKSFSDVVTVYNMTPEQVSYITNLESMNRFTDTVYDMSWKLTTYSDNSKTPIVFVLQYLLTCNISNTAKHACIECMNTITKGGISSHTAVTRFLFEAKYVE